MCPICKETFTPDPLTIESISDVLVAHGNPLNPMTHATTHQVRPECENVKFSPARRTKKRRVSEVTEEEDEDHHVDNNETY